MSDGIDPKATGLEVSNVVQMQPATKETAVTPVLPPATAGIWSKVGALGVLFLTVVLPALGLQGIPLIVAGVVGGVVALVGLFMAEKRVTPQILEAAKSAYGVVAPAVVEELAKRQQKKDGDA